MIPNLKPYELNDYLNRITEVGIDGLEGIEKFQANQLRDWLKELVKEQRNFAVMMVAENPDYNYPAEFRDGNESLFWLRDGNYSKHVNAIMILNQFFEPNTDHAETDVDQQSEETEKVDTPEKSELYKKIEKAFGFMADDDKRKYKPRLSEEDYSKFISWTVYYFENSFELPNIEKPIQTVNTNKNNIVYAFKDFFKTEYPEYPQPDSLYNFLKVCFYPYRNDKISNLRKVSQPQFYGEIARNR